VVVNSAIAVSIPSGKTTEAKRVKASLSTDVSRGEYRETCRLTFAEYAQTWIESYAGRTSRGIREQTRKDY